MDFKTIGNIAIVGSAVAAFLMLHLIGIFIVGGLLVFGMGARAVGGVQRTRLGGRSPKSLS